MAPRDTLSVGRSSSSGPTQAVAGTEHVADAGSRQHNPQTQLHGAQRRLAVPDRPRFRVGIDQIARWNKIDKNKILQPGQKLTMYVDVTAQSS